MIRARVQELRLAVMLLTRLPVGRLRSPAPSLAQAQWAYPLVGLPVGLIGWGALQGALLLGLPALPAAALCLLVLALVTGGLHHDGLADFADGAGGGRDRAHALEIMKDSRLGSYGALALIFAVLLGGSALASVADSIGLAIFCLIAVASRLAMLITLSELPPARDSGLGQSAAGTGSLLTLAPGAALCAVLAVASGWAGLAAIIAGGLIAGWLAWAALRRLGGQTGDVLGAVQLSSEVAMLVALSAALG